MFELIWLLVLLAGGLVILIWGSNAVIDTSSRIATYLGLPSIMVGLIIVSVGTSIPEISTSITSSMYGHGDIAIGNIIGSDLVQLTLILGIVSLITPLRARRHDIITYGSGMILALMFMLVVIEKGYITQMNGLFLILSYFMFIFVVYYFTEKTPKIHERTKRIWVDVGVFIVGLVCVIIGANLVVDSTIKIATLSNIPEYIISFYAVGLGTSMPELFVSGMAAMKKKLDISVGNLLGSNITDPTLSLGVGAIVSPLYFETANPLKTGWYLLIFTFLVVIYFAKRRKIDKNWGIFLVLAYVFSYLLVL